MIPYLNLEYLYYNIYQFFKDARLALSDTDSNLSGWVFIIKIILVFISVLFIAGITYNVRKIRKIRNYGLKDSLRLVVESVPEVRALRWEKVKKYLESNNSSDWRRAILEADNLFDEIFKKAGYGGSSLGERILKIPMYKFESIGDVFKAHLARNKVVKQGDKFELTKEEADRILGLYEKGLKELGYI
ncbi:MAG: hypothetical protein Q7R75_00925 [bacterium]|nr:hypothetical protein [bacterium]